MSSACLHLSHVLFLSLTLTTAARVALSPPPQSTGTLIPKGLIQRQQVSSSITNGLNNAQPTYSGLIMAFAPPSTLSMTTPLVLLEYATAGLNPLSLASAVSSPAPSAISNQVVNLFNGVNVQFPGSTVPVGVVLASVISDANQMVPTGAEILQDTLANVSLTATTTIVLDSLAVVVVSGAGSRTPSFFATTSYLTSIAATMASAGPTCSPTATTDAGDSNNPVESGTFLYKQPSGTLATIAAQQYAFQRFNNKTMRGQYIHASLYPYGKCLPLRGSAPSTFCTDPLSAQTLSTGSSIINFQCLRPSSSSSPTSLVANITSQLPVSVTVSAISA